MGKIIQFPPPEEREEKNLDPLCSGQPNGETCEPGDQTEQNGNEEISKPGLFELMSEMPGCISNKILAQIVSAAGFLIAGFVILFAFRMKQSILLVIMAGWLAWNAILTVSDYRHGKIIEESVICVSATPEKCGKRPESSCGPPMRRTRHSMSIGFQGAARRILSQTRYTSHM